MAYRYNTARLDYRFRNLTGYLDYNNHAFVARLPASGTLAADDLCYIDSNGKMAKVDADAEASASGMLAICTEALSADGEGAFILQGFYTTSGLNAGEKLYMSTDAGTWTSTRPILAGDMVRIIGYAVSSTQLFFNPDPTWIELA